MIRSYYYSHYLKTEVHHECTEITEFSAFANQYWICLSLLLELKCWIKMIELCCASRSGSFHYVAGGIRATGPMRSSNFCKMRFSMNVNGPGKYRHHFFLHITPHNYIHAMYMWTIQVLLIHIFFLSDPYFVEGCSQPLISIWFSWCLLISYIRSKGWCNDWIFRRQWSAQIWSSKNVVNSANTICVHGVPVCFA